MIVSAAGEDEIDWDEDDNKPTTEPAAAAVAAGGQGRVPNPTAVPNQKVDIDPSTTSDLKVTKGEDAPKAADGGVASADATTTDPAAEAEEPKPDFSIGLEESDAQKEAAKRAARAKRFGIPENEEAKKLAERAKKFGTDQNDTVVKGLDSALPERRAKRGREDKEGGRAAKRQTPDRRTGPKPKPKGAAPVPQAAKKQATAGKITDDPVERAKMEARAKKFGKPLTT
jgi:SAP domain-containing ribonucleoprotein